MTQPRIGLDVPSPDKGGVAGGKKLAGRVIVVACCWWAASVEPSRAGGNWLIWGAPLAVFPVSYAGRKALDARPTAAHASRMDIAVQYAVGAALGMGIFPAFRRLLAEPVIQKPWLRHAVPGPNRAHGGQVENRRWHHPGLLLRAVRAAGRGGQRQLHRLVAAEGRANQSALLAAQAEQAPRR